MAYILPRLISKLPWYYRAAYKSLPYLRAAGKAAKQVRGGWSGAAASAAAGGGAAVLAQHLKVKGPKMKRKAGPSASRPAKRARTRTRTSSRQMPLAGKRRVRPSMRGSRGFRGKRARSGSGPTNAGAGTSGDVQYFSKKMGRKPKNSLSNLAKRVNASIEPCYYRWNYVLGYENPSGALSMQRDIIGTIPTSGASENMPFYIFNLTAIAGNTGGAAIAANVAYRLQKQWVTGPMSPIYNFISQQGLDSNATLGSTTYQVESGNSATRRLQDDILDWVDIRLDCVGPTAIPTKWWLQLVQFKDPVYTPEYLEPVQSGLSSEAQQREMERLQLYDTWVQPLITHPILLQNPKIPAVVRKQVKILHQVSFITQPKESIDKFQGGQEKIIKMFKWLNKSQRYDWSEQGRPPATNANGTEKMGYAANTASFYWNDVEPTKRVYLVVKCQNHTPGAPTTNPTPAEVVGTFDIVIRTKHSEDVS